MTTGENIKRLRLAKGATQVALAKMANLRQGALSEYESGASAPSIDKLGRIADVLGVSVAVLDESLRDIPGVSIVSNTKNDHGQMIVGETGYVEYNNSGEQLEQKISQIRQELIDSIMLDEQLSAEQKILLYNKISIIVKA